MSLYVLDTDILSLYEKGQIQVRTRVDAQSPTDIAITVMSVEEQLSGWYAQVRKAKKPKELADPYRSLAAAVPSLARWQILPFTESAIHRFKRLKTLKLNVGGMDLCIAAITLEYGGILVSRNLRDFQRVPGLSVEDWSV